MSNQQNNPDSFDNGEFDVPKLPSGLNVLTILTFIGSAFALYSTVSGFLTAETNYQKKDEVINQMKAPEVPAFVKGFLPPIEHLDEMFTKSYENRLPIFILGLVATALCIFGALQMRKLKKQGFLFYVIGQLLPFFTTVLFIGTFIFSGFLFMFFSVLSLLFILLYFFQRKHLVY
jgi:hypothetical protein